MKVEPQAGSVRARLARRTADAHLALHRDPLLSQLTAPDVSVDEFLAALRVFMQVNLALERRRRQSRLWPEFSLATICAALTRDLGARTPSGVRFDDLDRAGVLGALYVVHGAGFGRAVFRRSVLCVRPEVPRAYLDLPLDATTWRRLCAALEEIGSDPLEMAALSEGATRAFLAYRAAARREGEAIGR